MNPLWSHQDFGLSEVRRMIEEGKRKICLTSPTGGGKGRMICEAIEWVVAQAWHSILYTNRRLLTAQCCNVFSAHGIPHGVRAAGYEDRRELAVQISSLPTENARTLKSDKWRIHGEGHKTLAIVDEAHLNSSNVACEILRRHLEAGGVYLGVTATPIDLGHLYDDLIVAGTVTELQQAGVLVRAYHYGPDEPDMRKFKQNVKTGEYTEGDVRKAIMHKQILGRVLENYNAINADRRPTILFAPGVQESIWFAEQLTANGISAAHIDGNGVWLNGEYQRGGDRDYILKACRDGVIKVLCNRFVLREGLDLPEVSHIILATVMGALRTYLQSCGRGLRSCSGKDRLTIQDHGGHWWRHGSVNADRHWDLNETETMIHAEREEKFREKKAKEPIRCPKCSQIRSSGPSCPQCGYEAQRGSRLVVQMNGNISEHSGDIFKPRFVLMKSDTLRLWERMYHRARNSKTRMTFRQAEGFFAYENHYWPPRDLPYMPTNRLDWFRPVADVPRERLSQ